ncbi:NAD(P)H-hydrate dehydratase [Candidatus Woesearchaeota archaeon]|nr:MAG: sugar kinase [archaeon GW2011_AR4]MBS3129467.1 NAD(P)H-hydrate dehydratase [Candidatus Woesearchaeota archaeon]HIH38913.1 NAD(P)H-hydrate dehydratase [Candidatus Woesearchaeota archaeon]HIH49683.1 NAD(P)H-hydrate dehydratase [Candidatus Woesearchaeota archaeon]HIJ03754.1 NAD(P)H-hydrate dehydratase [Candidatus Woesearchaeota archaeon]
MRIKKRDPKSHKGQNGVITAIVGSELYPGAAFLSCTAALRSGCDLVYVLTPAPCAGILQHLCPELIVIKLPGAHFMPSHKKAMEKWIAKADVLLIGPGTGKEGSTKQLIKSIVLLAKPKVIDADPLRYINPSRMHDAVLTPHQDEALSLQNTARCSLMQLAKKGKNIVILEKGRIDRIHTKTATFQNRAGSAAMTKGGTGDILAGLVAGFIAQGNELAVSARAAAWYNGKAGELLTKRRGNAFLTREILDILPEVMLQ